MAAASTNNSASRPMVPGSVAAVLLSGGAAQGGAGLPEAHVRDGGARMLLGGPEIDGAAREWGPGGTAHSAFRQPLRLPTPHERVSRRMCQRHESILRKGGARRATAAARRRTAGAFFVEARASSVE